MKKQSIVIILSLMLSFSFSISQTITLLKRDAVVWSRIQAIGGIVDTSVAVSGWLKVNNDSIKFNVVPLTNRFSVPVLLNDGVTTLIAQIDSMNTIVRSDTLRLTFGYKLRPEALVSSDVTGRKVTLRLQIVENPDSPTLNVSWLEDPKNPVSVQWVSTWNDSATLNMPIVAPQGEYYFTAIIISSDGDTVRARTFVTVDSAAIRPFNIKTDYATWIKSAVIYGITPYIFVGNGKFKDITEKIPDIIELGVNTIWLQPTYATFYKGQGYDVIDYFSVRSDLGTEEDLRTLIRTAHEKGLRVLFDFVPNHTSIKHPYAQQAIQYGEQSHYYDFYQRTLDTAPYSMHYNTRNEGKMNFVYYFWNDLPNLNYDNPEVQRMIIEAGKYWIEKFDIDGYRIDAVWGTNARRPDFMKRFRLSLKSIKPDILLLGEDKATWASSFDERFDVAYDWAASESWVSQWVWAQSYSANSNPTIFNTTPQDQRAQAFRKSLTNNGNGYHERAVILRFMENNDTFRFLATHDDARTRMVAATMFSLPGIPLLYNGQEIGASDHPYSTYELFYRGVRNSSLDKTGLFSFYQYLIHLRNTYGSLTDRNFQEVVSVPSAYTYGFRRWKGEENIFVQMNMGSTAVTGNLYIPLDKILLDSSKTYYFTDLITGEYFPATVMKMNPFQFPSKEYSTRLFVLDDSIVTTSVPTAKAKFTPGVFSLEQNYPNPFNPVTTIVFDLPERGMVSVKVFDLVGREITTLVHEERPAGQYTVLFDGSGLASGIYFYRIQFNRQSAVKKMVLLK